MLKYKQIHRISIRLNYGKSSISTTSIITVELFVTTAQLARGQTSNHSKNWCPQCKNSPCGGNSGYGKNLILQFNSMCKKNSLDKVKIHSSLREKITVSMLLTGNILITYIHLHTLFTNINGCCVG